MFHYDAGFCLLFLFLFLICFAAPAIAAEKVVIDTDFAMPPQDDALALMLAINSPELRILGISTVAGNQSQEQAVADLLRFLEITGCENLPVYPGAARPLVHEVSEFAIKAHGEWYSSAPAEQPPGGFASKREETQTAADFLIQVSKQYAGQLSIIALGPLTNIATAIRQDPDLRGRIKRLNIMGGAVASLPDGAGNITPNAEFNFWVDPEAARIVLRSGIPIELSPLNVSRKTGFRKEHLETIASKETAFGRLLKATMGSTFRGKDDVRLLMYDQVAVASVIDPTLVKKRELYVDVDTCPGISYGVSVGGDQLWPGAEGAKKVWVQYDLDWERFIRLFVERLRQ